MNKKPDYGRKSMRPVKINKRQSQSAECLQKLVEESTERKASTPTFDRTTRSDSPDISCIDKHLHQSSNAESSQTKHQKVTANKKTVQALEQRLEHEYVLSIQSAMKCELAKRKASEVEDMLKGLQERVAKSQNILEKSRQRLKAINFYKEIELLHNLHHPNYAKVLETLDGSNGEEKLAELQKKLEDEQNLLQLKNISVPHSGGDKLCSFMAETTEHLKQLQANSGMEQTHEILKEVRNINATTTKALESCTASFVEAESLVLERKTLESSLHNLELVEHSPKH